MTIGGDQWIEPHDKPRKAKTNTRRWWLFLRGYVDGGLPNVSSGATCVWLVLFVQSRDRKVTLSFEKISKRTGYSVRQCRRFVDELVESKALVRLSRGNRIKGPTTYLLTSFESG